MFPRVVSDSQGWKREGRGGDDCVLGTGKRNVREYCQTTNHMVIHQFFPPLLPCFFSFHASTAGDPPGKLFPFLEGYIMKLPLFTELRNKFSFGLAVSHRRLSKGLFTAEVAANSLAVIVHICLRPRLCKTITVESYFCGSFSKFSNLEIIFDHNCFSVCIYVNISVFLYL